MNEFFGIDMTYIMIALLVVLAIAIGTILWVAFTNRVIFLIGVRNIPRRRAQTTLIVIGLMLSTLIIATAFSIGDTVDYSITKQTYDRLSSIDEVVQARGGDDQDPIFGSGGGGLISAITIAEGQARQYINAFRRIDGVDGAMGVVRGPAAAQNEAKGQTEPLVILVGVDPAEIEGFEADFETVDGERVSPAELGADEIFANESAAEQLSIEAGDTISLFVGERPAEFTVRAILKDRALTGSVQNANEGFLLPRDRAQELFGRPGEIDFIAVSNVGGVREGMHRTDEVTAEINALLQGTKLEASPTKKDAVETAAELSSFLVTFFVVLGLFSIGAGMLLVFLIFVMLAAERKVEMGMVRAVGMKRRHLVQMFQSEGMIYNVGAAAIGAALGIAVSIVMVRVMARLFADFDLSIEFNVTPRSLIVAYSIGVVLTFLTVTFSSWRIGNLNIVSAIRDTADPITQEDRPEFRGLMGIPRFLRWLLFKPTTLRQWAMGPAMIVGGVALGAASIGLFMVASGLYDTSSVASAAAVTLGVLGGGLMLGAIVLVLAGLNSIFQLGPALVVVGLLLMVVGLNSNQGAPFAGGFSFLIFGGAIVLSQLRFPPRPVYTSAGLLLLVAWLLMAGGNTPFEKINTLEGDIELFFISGVSMVLAATFVLVYNADLLLGLLTFAGRFSSRMVPAIRTAVAYPLANKFRTGMTIAMISLVMFALVMMSTMNENFDRIFLSAEAQGGYDIVATENPANSVPDLVGALEEAQNRGGGSGSSGSVDPSLIAYADRLAMANPTIADIALDDGGPPDWKDYPQLGASPGFAERNTLTLQTRARGFETDADVWRAIASGGDYAVVDAFAVPQGGFGPPQEFRLEGVKPTDRIIDPIPILIRDSATGQAKRVEIIGILSTAGSGLFSGVTVPESVFNEVYSRPLLSMHYVQLTEGADSREVAQDIESVLLYQGLQADSLEKIIEDFQAQSRGFLYLIQGFMGIGLFVGIAAVGVIAFRTVVERRQQIGMLRAIGYTRSAIAWSFIMESSFTALLGITSGIGLALLLAYQLVNTDDFVPGGVASFYIPWGQILAVGGFAFLASLVMTIIPSRQASSIPIAEALRYE